MDDMLEGERDSNKLNGADLRQNLTNFGLNPPTRVDDLSSS